MKKQPAVTHLKDLTLDPRNANKGTPQGAGLIEKSLRMCGAGRSILIDKHGTVIAGNKTLEGAVSIGLDDVIVVQTDGTKLVAVQRTDLDLREGGRAVELALFDNRSSEVDLAWDVDVLRGLAAEGMDLAPFEFTEELLADIVGEKAGLTDPDDVPAERATDIKGGDLFELGAHRLLCGDSTKAEDVARVMGGEKAQCVFTDPPYGVDYDGGTKVRAKLAGDGSTSLYEPACRMAFQFSDEESPLYLWHAGVKGIAAAAAAAGYEIRCELVWNKNQAQFGALSAQYKQKHEPAYYCFKKGKRPRWFGPTNEVTVWDCDRSSVNEFHPTQKPVELAVRALHNSSEGNNIVLDLFGGSGSTLMACQQVDRRARLIEIVPSYVQVIIDRWEAFTGQQAVKVA